MKKLLALTLTLCLLLSLAACGGGFSSRDPNLGLYEGETVDYAGVTLNARDYFGDDFSIELRAGGNAVFRYNGDKANMKWSLNGTRFHAEGGGETLDGTLSNGTLVVENLLGTGMNITFVNHSYSSADAAGNPGALTVSTPEPTPDRSWWEGKWYGWGVFYQGSGAFADWEDVTWDAVAEITVSGDTGTLTVWDVDDMEKTDLYVEFRFVDGSTDMGGIECLNGTFLERLDMREVDWMTDPFTEPETKLEHMLYLEFTYTDSDGSQLRVCYVLRPWGMEWEDVRNADTDGMLYADMMPQYYESWYLPQIGASAPAGQEAPDSGGDPSVLYGQWAHSSGYVYTFREDGTGSYARGDSAMTFTYTVQGDQLSILYDGNTSPFVTTFRVENGSLIILDSFGSEVVYVGQ